MQDATTSSVRLRNGAAWAEMLARAADKNVRLNSALERAPRRSPRSRRPLVEELERERGRIARELHAGAGQPLAGIKLNLDLLDHWFHGASGRASRGADREVPREVMEALARLQQLTEAALGQVRAVSHRLHPPDWQDLTTAAALQTLVADSGIEISCRTVVDVGSLPEEPSYPVKVTLYRCAQECISNVLRHSQADRFFLALTVRRHWIEMRVTDNGTGFRPESETAGGIGLLAIHEHAEAVGGRAKIDSSPKGTTITICVPISEE